MSSAIKRYILDLEHIVPRKTNKQTYETVKQWLEENEIKITKETEPNHIEAEHGKRFLWNYDGLKMQKKYSFLINETENGESIMRVIMDTPWHNKYEQYIPSMRRTWHKHLEPLWERLGVELDPELEDSLFGISSYHNEVVDNTRKSLIGVIILLISSIIGLYGLYLGKEWSLVTFLSSMGFVSAFFSWTAITNAKTKFNEFNDEIRAEFLETESVDANKIYKQLAIIVFIVTIGFGYWVFTQPYYVTYQAQGYTFEYPRTWSAETSYLDDVPEDLFESVECRGEEDYLFVAFYGNQNTDSTESTWNLLSDNYENIFDEFTELESGTYSSELFQFVTKKVSVTEQGEELWVFFGLVYESSDSRVYLLSYMSEYESDETSFNRLLDSFRIDTS